jgi:hypothetical protein
MPGNRLGVSPHLLVYTVAWVVVEKQFAWMSFHSLLVYRLLIYFFYKEVSSYLASNFWNCAFWHVKNFRSMTYKSVENEKANSKSAKVLRYLLFPLHDEVSISERFPFFPVPRKV